MILDETTLSALTRWENFYVIVGSSAGALTGLQFVVITLVAEARTGSIGEIRAFGTPTVVHFCVALLISAVISAPWHTLDAAGVALAVCGLGGVAYLLTVIRHARRQSGYQPDAEDWFWYVGFPFAAYITLLAAAVLITSHTNSSLFLTAATALMLLFIGIHNSWDTVTYIATQRWRGEKE